MIFNINKYICFTFVLISSILYPHKIHSQNMVRLQGVVYDANTHNVVEAAHVAVINSLSATSSDSQGRFKTEIVPNKKTIVVVSHINYYKKEIPITDSILHVKYLTIELTPKTITISDVVITAGLYEQALEKITTPANLIIHREIVDQMYSNMTDLIASIPGFTQVWEYHSPIILRGLNSNRLIIMKDGNRRIGTFPGGYFGQDMNIYDTKKLEIIKGPSSVIYGSGAISGIINVISNEPFGNHKNSIQIHSGYGSNNNEFLELIKLCHKKQKYGISLNGKFRKTGQMTYGKGIVSDNSDVEDRDIALNTGYRFSDHHQVVFNANYHYGDWGKPRGFNGPEKAFTKIRNEEENFHTDVAYTYSLNKMIKSIHLNLYYDKGWRDYYQYKYSTVSGDLSSLDLVHYKDNYGGGRFYTILNVSKDNTLTAGIDGYVFRLDNPTDIYDYYNNRQGHIEGYSNAGQHNTGIFINDDWTIGKKIKMVTGIRYDIAEVVEGSHSNNTQRNEKRNAFSGNAGFVYSLNNFTHVSLNAGRAFRMPTAEELFTTIISCKGIKQGNPDLLPEYSWNFDLGVRGFAGLQKLKYDFALFYNLLESFINEAPVPNNAEIDFTYENTNATIMGGEFSLSYKMEDVFAPVNTLNLGASGAYVYGIDMARGNNEPLFGIPPFKVSLEADYRGSLTKKFISGYSLTLHLDYAAAQKRIAAIPEGTEGGPWGYIASDPYTILNVSMGLYANALPGYPKLRFIINNLLNTNYQPFGSYIPAMGRNFKIILSFHF
jgi:outer membrane receptor protein involved in Fe transport